MKFAIIINNREIKITSNQIYNMNNSVKNVNLFKIE